MRESVEVLEGGGPADVVELTLALAREMLAGAGVDDVDPADVLASGKAMDAWRQMIAAQGGDPDADLPDREGDPRRHGARGRRADPPRRVGGRYGGLATRRRAREAGRRTSRPVPASSGTPGPVTWSPKGEPLMTLHTDEPDRFERALAALEGAYDVSDEPFEPRDLVIDRIEAS